MDALVAYVRTHVQHTCITCAVWNTVVSPPFASGAFGRVYRGSVDGQDVAVKTIRSEEGRSG